MACTTIINDQSQSAGQSGEGLCEQVPFFRHPIASSMMPRPMRTPRFNSIRIGSGILARGYARQRRRNLDAAAGRLEPGDRARTQEPCRLRRTRGLEESTRRAWADALSDFNQAIALRQDFARPMWRGRAPISRPVNSTGAERSQYGDLDQSKRVQNGFLLARPGLSPQGRHGSRDRRFLTRDRAGPQPSAPLLCAGAALRRQGRLRPRHRRLR